MAKIRVYELAKELQMENKALVDLIREMGIEVKSHSSSLTEEEVSLIKGHIQGTKSLVVEEQRIQSGVIRRRKKIVEVEPPARSSPAGPGTIPGKRHLRQNLSRVFLRPLNLRRCRKPEWFRSSRSKPFPKVPPTGLRRRRSKEE